MLGSKITQKWQS